MPIAARTHGQHALPPTFGYKPAVWIHETLGHVERLEQTAPCIFVAMLAGRAGTFASLGAYGPAPRRTPLSKADPFADLLAADPHVTAHLDERAINPVLDPTAYTGLCAEMVRDAGGRALQTAAEIGHEARSA